MPEIRAFVAHSFDAGDAAVVSKFLVFLSELQRGPLDFSWEHAKSAEARSVVSKVLSLLDGKNTLIAICTKAEATVDESTFANSWSGFGRVLVKKTEITWKTSDWIVQEIGLAFALRMTIVLLLERGLRKPGWIQGDLAGR